MIFRNDQFLLSKKMENPKNFWKFVSKKRFPILKNAALKLFSMFGSTFICECAFSAMNIITSKNRNQLENITMVLQDCLRMATINFLVDTSAIVKKACRPQKSHQLTINS